MHSLGILQGRLQCTRKTTTYFICPDIQLPWQGHQFLAKLSSLQQFKDPHPLTIIEIPHAFPSSFCPLFQGHGSLFPPKIFLSTYRVLQWFQCTFTYNHIEYMGSQVVASKSYNRVTRYKWHCQTPASRISWKKIICIFVLCNLLGCVQIIFCPFQYIFFDINSILSNSGIIIYVWFLQHFLKEERIHRFCGYFVCFLKIMKAASYIFSNIWRAREVNKMYILLSEKRKTATFQRSP